MTCRLEMGQRSRLGMGMSISAAGEDVRLASSRLLFSTDVRFAQILFEAEIEMHTRTQTATEPPPNFPGVPAGSGVTTYYTQGYGVYVFPRALSFVPVCFATVVGAENTGTTYRISNLLYAPTTGSVEVFYFYTRTSDPAFSRIAVKVMVMNIPVDGG